MEKKNVREMVSRILDLIELCTEHHVRFNKVQFTLDTPEDIWNVKKELDEKILRIQIDIAQLLDKDTIMLTHDDGRPINLSHQRLFKDEMNLSLATEMLRTAASILSGIVTSEISNKPLDTRSIKITQHTLARMLDPEAVRSIL